MLTTAISCYYYILLESGRLFVWGENHFGQLGISNNNNNNNNYTSNSTNVNKIRNKNEPNNVPNIDERNKDNVTGIITKPTCVKSLKNLGLRIADIAFGQNWSIILTRMYCIHNDLTLIRII